LKEGRRAGKKTSEGEKVWNPKSETLRGGDDRKPGGARKALSPAQKDMHVTLVPNNPKPSGVLGGEDQRKMLPFQETSVLGGKQNESKEGCQALFMLRW